MNNPTETELMGKVSGHVSAMLPILTSVIDSQATIEERFDALTDVLVAKGLVSWDELRTQILRNRAAGDQAAAALDHDGGEG